MVRRVALVVGLVVTAIVVSGCTKCGPIWEDWQSPKSCRSDRL
ncbi:MULTISPECIES: hypothetical protein [Rhodopseudomonas]|uniref:FKBP-type peptidyl-prolyl cis-trans isomerase 1 n=1 Tax=Rhodopseudomonas palustris (strain DX-1) TaxID=652103 RepID=E6VIA2_RHOPX|nr:MULTISPECIES: hypothetical protein [Rhodopseudomonas]NEW89393.1 peptidylprolyl isomerase [Rhodopseudomonas sp. WA056]